MAHTFAVMPGYTPCGAGWRVAYGIDTIVKEVRIAYPAVTCVGTLGDHTHQLEGGYSAHNPIIIAPDGNRLVMAVDLVGPQPDLDAIRSQIESRYNAGDPRQFAFGFTNMNGQGTVWDGDPHTILHYTGGDYGHLHENEDTHQFPINPGDYTPAMDSVAPWGIATTTATPHTPLTPHQEDEVFIIKPATGPTSARALVGGGRVVPFHDAASVKAFMSAGVTTLTVSLVDYKRFTSGA